MYDIHNIKVRAIKDDILVTDMNFGEIKTKSGIVLRSDNGQSHGVKPRWGLIYKVGPEQKDFKPGQWILVEHGRWTRKIKINDGESEKEIQKVDNTGILAVSDDAPGPGDVNINNSGY
jgi:co-chaperonin GroES (HSP10)